MSWRTWLGLDYVAPVEEGPVGPETIDVLRAVETAGGRAVLAEMRHHRRMAAMVDASRERHAVISRAVAALGDRLDGAERALVSHLDSMGAIANEQAIEITQRLIELDARIAEAKAALHTHFDDRLQLFRPPAVPRATAHADADVSPGVPVLVDCGHLTGSFVTNVHSGQTRCLVCHAAAGA